MHHQNQEPLSFASLALALAGDYSSLFVIDYENDSYVEYAPHGTDKELVVVSEGENFFQDVRLNCREQVWKDDQEYFLNAFQKEGMTKALENGQSFSLTYRLNFNGEPRYFFLKTIRANDRNIIIGVQDIDAQKRKELENEAASRTYSQIASSLASLFEVIYHVDIETGHFSVYSSSEQFAKLGLRTSGEDFFERAHTDLQAIIHPDDQNELLHALQRGVLLNAIRKTGSVSLTYRQTLNGSTQYMNLLAFRQLEDENHIVIGVRNIDAEKKRESASETYAHIAGALASRYEVIYYIDIDTNAYTQYSASEQYSQLGITEEGEDFFASVENDVPKIIHSEDRERLQIQLRKNCLLKNLHKTGSLNFHYRQMLDGRYQYMSMVIVHPQNDEHHIIVGVVNTDAQVRHEMSIREQSQTFSDISMALAQRYEVIYHVNINTNEYTEYSASDKYTRLKVGTKGRDFFRDTQENMKRDIYPEDLPMMATSMQKETLLKSLAAFGKTYLNYRLMLDGRAQYVSLYAVRPKEDSEHIIIAVANVDAAKRMELAYHNAMDMANRDALTGVKNKRAYVQAETDLDEQIQNAEQPPFSIVLCDINGLKQVNDTQGHKAGDDYIRSCCSFICNTFKHSPVFRIGGDEFVVILRGQDFTHRDSLMEQLRQTLDENRRDGVLLLASGISEFDPQKDMRVQDVFERADTLMYADKELCKAEAGTSAR